MLAPTATTHTNPWSHIIAPGLQLAIDATHTRHGWCVYALLSHVPDGAPSKRLAFACTDGDKPRIRVDATALWIEATSFDLGDQREPVVAHLRTTGVPFADQPELGA